MGDAPESVAGVKTVGVLHAPGYPSYVLLARAFTKLVPIGDLALRVNLFSVVCATLTVVAVFLLARVMGASVLGASCGALALASSASFWFNAGFAKHYALSGLLITTAALAATWWQSSGASASLIVAAAALGVGIGASWELAVVLGVGVIALAAFGPRRPKLPVAAAAFLVFFAFAGAILAFMVVRARAHPAISWGEVTNSHRVLSQITQQDFRASSPQSPGSTAISSMPARAVNYLGIIVRDVGPGACLLAAVGVAAAIGLSRSRRLFLGVVLALNVLAVAYATGVDHIRGFFTGLFAGGYLIAALVVIAVLVALGTTFALDRFAAVLAGWTTPRRNRSQLSSTTATIRPYLAAFIVAIVIVPSLVVHYRSASHRGPPLADRYGARVLGELPRRAVLFVGGYEFGEPIRYRQIVDGDRRDVIVVYADLLGLAWYREQLARELGQALPPAQATNGGDMIALSQQLQRTRPVFVDTIVMYLLGGAIGYRADGFVGRVVAGTGPHAALGSAMTAQALDDADRADGLGTTRYLRFPNQFVYYFHQRAHIELAKQLVLAGRDQEVERQIQRAVDLVPSDTPARIALRHLQEHDPKSADLVRAL